ncbi:hypothetical protein [Nocardia sp. R7R-8]|uniref:hypothetical protein n=1 Tax=Nocardia sp. R7R-8 TaxID=3459304 RepID=UPI00403D8F5D
MDMLTDLVRGTDLTVPERTAALVGDVVIPGEERQRNAAKEAGVFAPPVPRECGGHGLGMPARTTASEKAGHSAPGLLPANSAAPDGATMHPRWSTARRALRRLNAESAR